MKILLVGFSQQSADVLQKLIQESYPIHPCFVIKRDFNDSLSRLALPVIPAEHEDAKLLIISLDGVGMVSFSASRVTQLQEFIKTRAVLFIAKADLALWRQANIIPQGFAHFLKSPHTKQEVMQSLAETMSMVSKLSHHAHEFTETAKSPTIQETLQTHSNIKHQKDDSTFLRQLVERHFNISKDTVMYELISMGLYSTPLKVTVGSQIMYLNKHKNLALVQNVSRLLDYFLIVRNYQSIKNVVLIQPISSEDFDEIMYSNTTHQKHPLNALLWQVYDKVLPDGVYVSDHNLLLKIKYMPNFGLMAKVPHYTHALVSSCLVAPKSVTELQAHLDSMTSVEAKGIVNKILLVSILSGVADLEVLQSSYNSDNTSLTTTIRHNQNDEVSKAKKTGFFKRLLMKLHLT